MQAGPHWGVFVTAAGKPPPHTPAAGAEKGVARVMLSMGQLRAQRPQRVQRAGSTEKRAGFIFTARNQG